MIKTTKAMYTCKGCGTLKREIIVAARLPNQNIVEWFEQVIAVAVSEDHKIQQPGCKETKADIGFQLDAQHGGD